MNEKDWLIIVSVYQHKNITRAAQQLYTSQPALSYRLKQIERKLAIRLFDESQKGLVFSAQGEFLAQHAQKVLRDLQQLKENLHSLDHTRQGEISLGVSSNYAAYRLPPLLNRFRQSHPGIRINLMSGLSEDIFTLLQRGEIDIAIVKDNYHWKEGQQLIDEDDYLLISEHDFDFALLPHLPQIRIVHGQHVTQLLERWWNAHFTHAPNIAMTVDKLEVCLGMVTHGLGYAIVASYLPLPEKLYRRAITLEGKAVKNQTWLLYRQQIAANPMMQSFIHILQSNAH
ncbi:MAG: LysR family transcriptional regulator [Rouxiella aceris]|uniref:LysR family transcriptional regulator n=1 Tax=Rouxiella aceris TaxID=2703884 RepID=UPI00284A4C19|nr:LysR family transcriptional regulator [Rouxiella aceris]MDR3433147.1 LysR family transcriptional regulator [Rouxiella aceris]